MTRFSAASFLLAFSFLIQQIRNGRYKSNSVRRVETHKETKVEYRKQFWLGGVRGREIYSNFPPTRTCD